MNLSMPDSFLCFCIHLHAWNLDILFPKIAQPFLNHEDTKKMLSQPKYGK